MAAAERTSSERLSFEELDAEMLEELRESNPEAWEAASEQRAARSAFGSDADGLTLPPKVRTVRDSQAPDEIPSPEPLRAVPLASPPVPKRAAIPQSSLPPARLPKLESGRVPASARTRSGRPIATNPPPLKAPPTKRRAPQRVERPPARDSLQPPPMGSPSDMGLVLSAQPLPQIPGRTDSLAPKAAGGGLGWPGVIGVGVACFALGVLVTWLVLLPRAAPEVAMSPAAPPALREAEPEAPQPDPVALAETIDSVETEPAEEEPRDAIAAIVEAAAAESPIPAPRRGSRRRSPRAASRRAASRPTASRPTAAPSREPASESPRPPAAAVESGPVARVRPVDRSAAVRANLPSHPSRSDVRQAIARVQPAIQACAPSMRGHVANIRFRFVSNGQATLATVAANTINDPQQRSCMARAARSAYVPPFAERDLVVTYPVQL